MGSPSRPNACKSSLHGGLQLVLAVRQVYRPPDRYLLRLGHAVAAPAAAALRPVGLRPAPLRLCFAAPCIGVSACRAACCCSRTVAGERWVLRYSQPSKAAAGGGEERRHRSLRLTTLPCRPRGKKTAATVAAPAFESRADRIALMQWRPMLETCCAGINCVSAAGCELKSAQERKRSCGAIDLNLCRGCSVFDDNIRAMNND